MLRDWLGRIPAAIAAAVYWYAAAWLCFAATGADPIDSLSAAGTLSGRIMGALILAAAVVVFALASRAVAARRRP